MKIKIERKSFIDALSVGGQMSGKARGLSILENIKLTIKNLTATISSYDSEVAITKRTSILEQDEDFTLCVEPKVLLTMLRSIKDNEVELSFERNKCEVIHSKGVLSLPYMDAEDFPTPIFDNEQSNFCVSSELLFNWLKEAKIFVSTNNLYPQMMGVYLYFFENEFGVASTDMNVLYNNTIEYDYNDEKKDAIISTKAVDALLPMINGSEKVTIMIGSRNVAFRIDDAMLVATKTEKPFPNFKEIIPKENEIEIEVSKDDFLESVKRAMITANEKTCLLKLNIGGMSIKINSEDVMNEKKSHEECFATCNGGELILGVKGTYVIDMVSSIESENIKILLKNERTPILWCDMLNNNKILLQMPCVVE
jgi:DNA polymerase-3 subunit beta